MQKIGQLNEENKEGTTNALVMQENSNKNYAEAIPTKPMDPSEPANPPDVPGKVLEDQSRANETPGGDLQERKQSQTNGVDSATSTSADENMSGGNDTLSETTATSEGLKSINDKKEISSPDVDEKEETFIEALANLPSNPKENVPPPLATSSDIDDDLEGKSSLKRGTLDSSPDSHAAEMEVKRGRVDLDASF